jgi:DNA-directed RNA polymerase specialized sigma24 family protein
VQEVFLTLWRDPTRFDPARGGFATWLLTVTHHRAVDAVRKESVIRRRVVVVPEAGEDWSPTPVPGADQAAMARVAAGPGPRGAASLTRRAAAGTRPGLFRWAHSG